MSESNNPAEAGTDTARPQLSMEQAKAIDWDDLGSEESNPEPDEAALQDDATDEADPVAASQETEEQTDEQAEAPAEAVSDDVIVPLDDGSKIPLKELKSGYLRQADYTRKSQEVANRQRDVAGMAEQLTGTVSRLAEYIGERFIPPEPDPQLAWTDPAQHYRMTQARNSALQELMAVMEVRDGVENAKSQISAADFAQKMGEEDAKLLKAFPRLSDPAKMDAFKSRINSFAKTLGFTEQEIATTADHRVRMLVHYAALGKEAEAAKAKAQTKVSKAAPMLPAKQRQHPNSAAALRNVNAMKQLERTGSLRDAMKIDFVD